MPATAKLPKVYAQRADAADETGRLRRAISETVTEIDRLLHETPASPARASLLTVTRELVAMRDRLHAAVERQSEGHP
jgi:hypothetical protein